MQSKFAALLFLVLIACLPACAGPILWGFTSPLLSGSPGDALTFQGSLVNTLGYDVYLNSWTINLTGFAEDAIDSTPFLLSPYPLGASETTPAFDWFIVSVPMGMAAGLYQGEFIVLGGANEDDQTVLDSLTFRVQVGNAVPEPGTAALLAAGLVLAAIRARRLPFFHGKLVPAALLLAVMCAAPALAAGPPMPAYEWHTFYAAAEPSSGNKPIGRGVAVDSAGNVYVVGVTQKPWNFAPGTPLHAIEENPYPYAGFIMKLSPSGELLWHTFYHITPQAIAIGPGDALYISGGGTFCNDGVTQPAIYGGADVCGSGGFAMKMDTNGLLLWYTLYRTGGEAIAVDPVNGYIYVGGNGNYISGPFPQPPLQHPAPREAPLVIALDMNGGYRWHTFLETGEGHALCVDASGSIIVSGMLIGSSGGAFVTKLYGPASGSAFGSPAWTRVWGGNRYAYGLAADATGNVYATGNAYPSSPLMTPLLHPADSGNPTIFVTKLDPDGNCLWYTMYGNTSYGRSIAVDPRGYVLVHGHQAFYDFSGDGGARSLHDNSYSTYDGGHFLLALNTDGAYQWHTFYGYPDYERPKAIALDANHNVYLTGSSGADWVGDNGAQPLNPHGASADSLYLQKFSLKAAPTVTWLNPAPITFGSALGTAQLNASADVPGFFTYTPPMGSVLPVGTAQILSAVFTPSDAAAYSSVSKNATIDVLPAPPAAPARVVATAALSRTETQVLLTVTIANTGGATAANVLLTTATINTASAAALPQSLGAVAAGANVTVTLAFPASLGAPGAAAILRLGGTYTGGSFSSTGRIRLP